VQNYGIKERKGKLDDTAILCLVKLNAASTIAERIVHHE
jgi:hypothetical protein